MRLVTTRRMIFAAVIVVIAVVAGVLFGYLAGVAVVLGAITLVALGLGPVMGLGAAQAPFREAGRRRFGRDRDDDSRP